MSDPNNIEGRTLPEPRTPHSKMCKPIAREGEPIYASIMRNRSGVSAGEIDFGVRVSQIELLCEGERQDICDTAYALYKTICQYAGKRAKNDAVRGGG